MFPVYNKNLGKWFINKIFNSIKKYKMVSNGEKIAIALSGGKDSIFLLFVMCYLKLYYPIKFDLCAIHVDITNFFNKYSLGPVLYSENFMLNLQNLCKKFEVDLYVEELGKFINGQNKHEFSNNFSDTSNLFKRVGIRPNKKTICSLCARLKRGVMVARCRKLGIKKIAFAHHATDVAETLLMNIVFSQKLASITPRVQISESDVQIIRPLVFIDEKVVISAIKHLNLPILEFKCPYGTKNIRSKFKEVIKKLENEIKENNLSEKIAKSLSNPDLSSLWPSLEA